MRATSAPEALALLEGTYRNFRDAAVEDLTVGLRQEVTMRIRPLIWQGGSGAYGPVLAVRFGGIEGFEQAAGKFRQIPALQSEIGFLGLDQDTSPEKPARLAFRFEAERRDFAFGFSCKSVSITQ